MSEALTGKVARIVSGSVHALVDAMENAAPETVLEQAIREIDSAAEDVRVELGSELAKKHLASTRLLEENQRHVDLSEKIELALKEQRDDLAEAAASKQLDIEAQIPVLERAIADCGDREKELEGLLSALAAKKRQMHDDLVEFRAHQKAAKADPAPSQARPNSSAGGSAVEMRVERASSAFDRVIEANTGVGGRVAHLQTEAQLVELESLARKNRVRERLAAAKAKIEAGS